MPCLLLQKILFYEDGLVAMQKALHARQDKSVSTDSLIELAECLLRNNYLSITFLSTKQ